MQDKAAVVLAAAGLQELLLMLLALRLDPVGQLLAMEIQVRLLSHAPSLSCQWLPSQKKLSQRPPVYPGITAAHICPLKLVLASAPAAALRLCHDEFAEICYDTQNRLHNLSRGVAKQPCSQSSSYTCFPPCLHLVRQGTSCAAVTAMCNRPK